MGFALVVLFPGATLKRLWMDASSGKPTRLMVRPASIALCPEAFHHERMR
jgi:hypothetical protein